MTSLDENNTDLLKCQSSYRERGNRKGKGSNHLKLFITIQDVMVSRKSPYLLLYNQSFKLQTLSMYKTQEKQANFVQQRQMFLRLKRSQN